MAVAPFVSLLSRVDLAVQVGWAHNPLLSFLVDLSEATRTFSEASMKVSQLLYKNLKPFLDCAWRSHCRPQSLARGD